MRTPTITMPSVGTDRRHIAPFVALFALMLVWALGGLFVIAREADRSDAARAREAVGRAFDWTMTRLADMAEINAVATPNAIIMAGPVVDRRATQDALRDPAPQTFGYYGEMLLDADDRPLVASKLGLPWSGVDLRAAVRLAAPVTRKLPRVGKGTAYAIVRDKAGVPFGVAASNVMPDDQDFRPDLARGVRRRLVIIHPVAELLNKIAPMLGTSGLALDGGVAGPNTQTFAVEGGRPVTLSWQPRTPGRVAVARWLPAMAAALALASALLGVAVRHSLAATRALNRLATRDQLTGLPNRACLLRELNRRLARAPSVALGLMDLNGFKAVNDTHGHLAGDDLLRAFAAEAAGAVAPGEMIARLGGDEFAFLGATLADAERFAAELDERLARPLDLGGLRLKVGSGIGIAVARPGIAARDLIALADARLYRDKAERNRGDDAPARAERTALTVVA